MTEDPKTAEKIGSFFDRESQSMRQRHEDEGIPDSMRFQVEAILEAKVSTALDVGSGPGSLLRELLRGGVNQVIGLDLSTDMNEIARERLSEEGFDDRVELINGSFLDIDLDNKPEAISMHRVLCCHPDRQAMVMKSAGYGPKIITITIPRDWKLLRVLIGFLGLITKITGWFRPYMHTQASVDRQLEQLNYSLVSRHKDKWWVTSTYVLEV